MFYHQVHILCAAVVLGQTPLHHKAADGMSAAEGKRVNCRRRGLALSTPLRNR